MSYSALDRAEIKLLRTAFCHQAKLEMCCDISVKTKNAYTQRQWTCDSSFCRSFALVFAHILLQKWFDCSHYTCGKCFCSVSFLICHASRALRGPTIFPSVLIRCIPLIHPFSFASLFPKWPPTPASTLSAKLTEAPAVIGLSTGKSTLTSLINWISWPLGLSEEAAHRWDTFVCRPKHTQIQHHSISHFIIIAKDNRVTE